MYQLHFYPHALKVKIRINSSQGSNVTIKFYGQNLKHVSHDHNVTFEYSDLS